MEKHVTLAKAKAHLSALVSDAEDGAAFTMTRHGKPVARIVGAPAKVKRKAGDWGWTGPFEQSALDPMTDDEMRDEGWPV